jgi:hypothetical protein
MSIIFHQQTLPPEPTDKEKAAFYHEQLERLGKFIMQNYNNEITGEAELEPTAVEIAIRLLNHGSTVDGILAKIHRKEW